MTKLIQVVMIVLSLFGLAEVNPIQRSPSQPIVPLSQQASSYEADLELAQRFAPVFYFHPDEIYQPQPVDVVLGLARLRQDVHMWFDTTILNSVTMHDLFTIPSDDTYFLDQWFGDPGSSEYANTSTHHDIYSTRLSPRVGGSQPVGYAHVVRNENPAYITIQYWLFYFYQDWFNKHEGDWEMVEVILTADEKPEWVVYSQHHAGGRRSWETTPREDGTHPVAYVARDSHANYFAADEVYPYKQDIGNQRMVLIDRTGSSGRLIPDIILIPTREELVANPDGWPKAEWLMFRGRWGETAVYGDFNGPYGPADKGDQWGKPYAWGMDQPLDQEIWYKNRLKVEISGPSQAWVSISLTDQNGQILSHSESLGNLAILHSNPPQPILAQVDGAPGSLGELIVSWPDPVSQFVTKTRFTSFELDILGHARLTLSPGEAQLALSATRTISIGGINQIALPSLLLETFKPIWDAPDTVLMGNLLPIHEILGGLLIALLYSLVPILIIIGILYWVDRYQKEPIRMLAFAFFWGAIPSLVIAILLQVFFKLPPDLLGPNALEAVRLGLLAPALEEVLKAAGVLFIYWRRPREINDVLDGMIYGAIVGFGFAFLSNFSRYTGNFISLGYPAFNLGLIAERTVHALDHGLYTAIFGAGLGFAIKARNRVQFWVWIMGALGLAIGVHALHNLLSNSTVGLNLLTVVLTILGTLVLWVIAGWSLFAQRRLLRQELLGLVHDSLYYSVQGPLSRAKAQWSALRREGFHTWLQVRKLQGLCIKLANTRLQARLFPEKTTLPAKAAALQAEITDLFARISLLTY